MNAKEFKQYIQNKDDQDIIDILKYDEILKVFYTSDICDIIISLGDKEKINIISNMELRKKFKLQLDHVEIIIKSLDNSSLEELLTDKEKLISIIGENNMDSIVKFISRLKDDDKKINIADIYDLNKSQIVHIISKCSDSKKKEILFSKKYDFEKIFIEEILSSFSIDNLSDFFKNNIHFIRENNIYIHDIIKGLSEDKQIEFVSKIEEMNLNQNEKRKSFVVLDNKVKEQIDRTHLKKEYIEALEMDVATYDDIDDIFHMHDCGKIILDLDGDLTKYVGLDELISIRPQNVPIEKHNKLIELANICPNLMVNDNLGFTYYSSASEFIEGEKWINSVLNGIDPMWTDVQKIAYIDNQIGKKISYTPDFNTEVSDNNSARALWKIICSGYGVCNGISQLEQYMLKRVGIEAELVHSKTHAFLIIKNIDIPNSDGSTIKGDSLLDPTWNLTSHRYDAYPNLFLRSYDEIRKFDILENGTDRECHKVKDLSLDFNTTIDVEEKVVRDIYKSIGLAKENGDFPISDMIEQSNKISIEDISLEQKIEKQLNLVKKIHPDFDKCQDSTISILAGNILNHPEMKFERLVVDRVYKKNDNRKRPIIYIYCNLDNEKSIFFTAENGQFLKMTRETFNEYYECYDKDLAKLNGIRPWEKGAKNIVKDLNQSSGKIVAEMEGDEK